MSATPHLLKRLARRVALACLRAKQRQLASGITALQNCADDDAQLLRQMRAEHRRISTKLATAEQPMPTLPHTTWGQP